MIVVPRQYADDLGEAVAGLSRARQKGMDEQLMKDIIDQICNEYPLYK